MRTLYDAADRSQKTLAECQAAVGKRATLPLTGTIVDAGESESGCYVTFEFDERWGFGRFQLGTDLDPLRVSEEDKG